MEDLLRLTISCVLSGLFLTVALQAQTPPIIPDSEASAHVGQNVTVEGIVSAVTTSRKGNTFINFGGIYPGTRHHSGIQLTARTAGTRFITPSQTIQYHFPRPVITIKRTNTWPKEGDLSRRNHYYPRLRHQGKFTPFGHSL
jgi:hypothetical protein